MANPATTDDIDKRWRRLSTEEIWTAEALLGDAWALVSLKVPDIESRLTAGTVDPALVRMVVCGAVLRVLKNLDGKDQESIEDYSYSFGSASAPGTLFLTDDEIRMLVPQAPGSGATTAAFTIRPYGAPDALPGWP